VEANEHGTRVDTARRHGRYAEGGDGALP
jgi:hypothetical protein